MFHGARAHVELHREERHDRAHVRDHGRSASGPAPSATRSRSMPWTHPDLLGRGANWWSVAPAQILGARDMARVRDRRPSSRRAAPLSPPSSRRSTRTSSARRPHQPRDRDQLVAVVLLTLLVVEKPNALRSTLLGLAAGVSMLGNTRLVFLPILCVLFVLWRLPRTRIAAVSAVVILAGSAVAVFPWLVRNETSVGCFTLTTDGRAMWKANNPRTYDLLRSGQWIDNIGSILRPRQARSSDSEEANGIYVELTGSFIRTSVCRCASTRSRVRLLARRLAGSKARALSAKLLWQPNVLEDRLTRRGDSSRHHCRATSRRMIVVYALALVRLFLVLRVRGTFALPSSPTRLPPPSRSSAPRATASRGFPARVACGATIEGSSGAFARDEGRAYPSHAGIGPERHLLTLLPGARQAGHEPVFIGLWTTRGILRTTARFASALRTTPTLDPLLAVRLVRALDADIVHTHLITRTSTARSRQSFAGAAWSRRHNDAASRRAVSLRQRRSHTPTVSSRSRKHYGVSPSSASRAARRRSTIHYGLDDLPEPWGENAADNAARRRVLLAVSRLTHQKGLDTAVGHCCRTTSSRRPRRRTGRPAPPRAVRRAHLRSPGHRRRRLAGGDRVRAPGAGRIRMRCSRR